MSIQPIETHARCICEPAERAPATSPFERVQKLSVDDWHKDVSLARCRQCGRDALYYSADTFDDLWQYWCLIDDAERAVLLEANASDEREERAREILERRPSLVNHPVRGFEWCPSGTCVMTGPPW